MKGFDFLDVFRRINNTLSNFIGKEVIKREIAYCERISKRFKCKYVYTVYYEEGFDSFLCFEDVPGMHEWHIAEITLGKNASIMNVRIDSYDALRYDAHSFYTTEGTHVVATNFTKEETE